MPLGRHQTQQTAAAAEVAPAPGSGVLLSGRGTLLAAGRDGALCHVPLGDDASARPICLPEAWDAAGALAGCRLEPGPSAGSVCVRRGDELLCANFDGRLSWRAGPCDEQQTLIVLSAADLAALRCIVTSYWVTVVAERLISPREIGASARFILHIGPFELDLRQRRPLGGNLDRDRLRFLDGGSVVFEAVRVDPVALLHDAPHATTAARMPERRRIWIGPQGNMGNRALQFLVAERLRSQVPHAVIENIHLPEWGLRSEAPPPPRQHSVRMGAHRHWLDIDGLADCLTRDVIDGIVLDCYAFNLHHYPSRDRARRLLGPTQGGADARGFGTAELVCSVRGGDILRGIHPHYVPLPPAYYRMLAERSGLDLVFYGQIDDDPYTESLRDALPSARFLVGRGPEYDFDMLRRSVHIAPSISTFAWLAAWLSEAERIYLPVCGLFNPLQNPDQSYLPLDDPAFAFTAFPRSRAIDMVKDPRGFLSEQRRLGEGAQRLDLAGTRLLCQRAAGLIAPQPHVAGFDPRDYLARYPDAARKYYMGEMSALEHYMTIGFREGRQPRQHPLVALNSIR